MKKRPLAIAVFFFAAVPAPAYNIDSVELPVLDLTVVYSHGSYPVYSSPPAISEKLTLDMNRILKSGKGGSLKFSNSYIQYYPFRVSAVGKTTSQEKWAYKFESFDGARPDNFTEFTVEVSWRDSDKGPRKFTVVMNYRKNDFTKALTILEGYAKGALP